MNKVLKYYVRIVLFVFPIFFLPIVVDSFGFGKSWFLTVSAMLGLLIWAVGLAVNKKEKVKYNGALVVILLLLGWAVISFLKLSMGVKMRSLLGAYGLGTLVGLAGWMFLWLQVSEKEEKEWQLKFLTASGLLVVISSIAVFLLPSSKLPIVWPKESSFIVVESNSSLTGSLVAEVFFVTFLTLVWLKKMMAKVKKGVVEEYIWEAVIAALFVLTLCLDGYRILKSELIMLDWNTSWVVAVDTFKKSPIFGAGIGNFLQSFIGYRPVGYNLTKYWTSIFYTSRAGFLQVWTELGIIGLLIVGVPAFGFLVRGGVKKKFSEWLIVIFILITGLMPLDIIVLFVLGWLLATKVGENKEFKLILNAGENNFNLAPYLVAAVFAIGAGVVGYGMGRIFLGEVYLRQSYVAAAKNDGSSTYNLQIKAIGMNPVAADYRKMYSQTNLALALNLLANKEIGEEDKQKAAVLVQQAAREAKSAVALDNTNSTYWVNLANIYGRLSGMVDGAVDWNYQALSQAVALDPVNPSLRLDFGGLLFAAGKYEEADKEFEKVILSKQDFANGWYNWAYTAKKMNKLAEAVQRLMRAVALVPVDSADYEKASKELDKWKKEYEELVKKQKENVTKDVNKTAQSETLKTPEPLPTVNKETKVVVPTGEMQPPETKTTE